MSMLEAWKYFGGQMDVFSKWGEDQGRRFSWELNCRSDVFDIKSDQPRDFE